MKNTNFKIIGWVAVGMIVGLGLGILYMKGIDVADPKPDESMVHDHEKTIDNEQVFTCSMHPQIRQH